MHVHASRCEVFRTNQKTAEEIVNGANGGRFRFTSRFHSTVRHGRISQRCALRYFHRGSHKETGGVLACMHTVGDNHQYQYHTTAVSQTRPSPLLL